MPTSPARGCDAHTTPGEARVRSWIASPRASQLCATLEPPRGSKGSPRDRSTPRVRLGVGRHVDQRTRRAPVALDGQRTRNPAILLTAATPAFAASGVTLSFANSSYSGEGCSTISGVRVNASENGSSQAGVAVTVSLPRATPSTTEGTSHTGTTGSDGSLTLPDISLPGTSNTSTATATASGAATASTTLIASAAPDAVRLIDGEKVTAAGIGAGATPLGGNLYLTSDKSVIDTGNSGAVVSSDIASAGHLYVTTGTNWTILSARVTAPASWVYLGPGSSARQESRAVRLRWPVCCSTPRTAIREWRHWRYRVLRVDSWGQMYFNGTDRFIPSR